MNDPIRDGIIEALAEKGMRPIDCMDNTKALVMSKYANLRIEAEKYEKDLYGATRNS